MAAFKRCLLIVILCLADIGYIHAQNAKVSINVSERPLTEVLSLLEKKSGYHFFFNNDIVGSAAPVTIKADNENLSSILNKILTPRKLSYKVNKKHIIIAQSDASKSTVTKEKALVNIYGKVVDNTGEPLVGVSVTSAGKYGAATDIDGVYSLKIPENSIVQYTYVGYEPVKQKITKPGEVNITLKENMSLLNEVVVTGYGATTRKNLTTSITSVKADGIQKAATSNVNSMLLGRAAGVQANVASPQPGGGINISVRGGGTPVYVVDGVVMPSGSLEGGTGDILLPTSINRSGLQGLNPSDIESIEVLKDAAAAIYGIGSADGVILITTKKGKTGKPTITYEGSYSNQQHYNYKTLLKGPELMNMVNLYMKENYLYERGQYPYGNTAYDGHFEPIFTNAMIRDALDTDWRSNVLRSGYITNHNLTISGGSEWVKYYLGLNYYDEQATVKNSDMERYSLRTNIQTKLTNFMRLTTVVNLNKNSYTNSTNGGDVGNQGGACGGSLFAAESYPSYLPVYDENGGYTQWERIPNPVSSLRISDRTSSSSWYANFALDIDIIKNILSVRGVYGINNETMERDSYIPSDVYFSLQKKSRGNIESASRHNSTLEGFINYNQTFGDIVDLSAMIGMGMYKDWGKSLWVSYENANDHLNSESIQKADGPFFPGSNKWGNEKRSQFARVTGDFLNRYVLQFSIRRDGTDKFFPSKKYSWFPSVSLAWKINNESFMRNIEWINMLKLRASYGETGSDNLGTSLYGLIGTTRENVMFGGNSVSYIPFVILGANYEDVTWQKTTMKNVGIDFSVLNDRLSGSIDLYRNDITHMLGTASTELLGMHGSRPINGGHFKREGIDISLNSTNISTHEFTWTTMLTLSHYKATWIERMPNYDYQEYQVRKNEPMSAVYFYKTDGLININKDNIPDSQRSLGEKACMPGFPIVVDKNGDGKIDVKDIYMRDMLPKLYYGLGNTFSYKGFDLDIFFYGQLGVKKYNNTYATGSNAVSLSYGVVAGNTTKDVYHVWNSQTNSANAKFPGIAVSKMTMPGNIGFDTLYEDASFLRVRNITLGYNLQPKTLGVFKGWVKGIRVYVDFQNPFTITRFKDCDPEIINAAANLNGGQFPQNRIYTFGAKLTF